MNDPAETPDANVLYEGLGWELLVGSPAWLIVIAALAIAASAIAVACWRKERRVLRRGGLVLLLLRLAAIAALALLLVDPQRRAVTQEIDPSRVVLLGDLSASMQLPARADGDASRNAVASDTLRDLDAALRPAHLPRPAGFASSLRYDGAPPAADSSRLGAALSQVLADHAATPLAAVVVVSDGGWNAGRDPVGAASDARARGVPIHTFGLGRLEEPPRLELRDLAAPGRAAVGDRFSAAVTVSINAAAAAEADTVEVALSLSPLGDAGGSLGPPVFESTVSIAAPESGGLASADAAVEADSPGRYALVARLLSDSADPADGGELRAEVELVDEPTRVLLAASGPTRDYRFLRDQFFRDPMFEADVLLQSAAGAVTQDAGRVLDALPASDEQFEPYDVIVAIDLDWRRVDERALGPLKEWVSRGGGGLIVYAGPVGTMPSVRSGLPSELRTLLPVTLRDDPLALSDAITPNRDAAPVRLTQLGEELAWVASRDGSADRRSRWDALPGFYTTPPPAEPKPGSTVLARLGDAPDSPPLLVEGVYGAGRVVFVAAAETWRLRTVDPAWFTELHAGMLRHAAQGRLRGAAAAGALLFDRRRYDVGDSARLRFIQRAPRPDEAPPTVRLTIDDQPPREVTLSAVDGEAGVFAATLRTEQTGRYAATLATPGGGALDAAAEVTLPSLETETAVQNAALLRELAESTGGLYFDLGAAESPGAVADAIARLAAATPSVAETTITIGPPDEAFARRVAQWSLGVMAGALLLEWTLRRSWRLA